MSYTTKRELKKQVEALEGALSQAISLLAEITFTKEMDAFDASLNKKPVKKKAVAKKVTVKKVAKKATTKK